MLFSFVTFCVSFIEFTVCATFVVFTELLQFASKGITFFVTIKFCFCYYILWRYWFVTRRRNSLSSNNQ